MDRHTSFGKGFFLAIILLISLTVEASADTNTCALSSQTITGKVETSQSLGTGVGNDIINSAVASQSGLVFERGIFQIAVLRQVVRTAGENNYPNLTILLNSMGVGQCNYAVFQDFESSGGLCPAIISSNQGILAVLSETTFPTVPNYAPPGFFGMAPNISPALDLTKIPGEVKKIKDWLSTNDPGLLQFLSTGVRELGRAPWLSGETIVSSVSGLACTHTNNYSYNFAYQTKQNDTWNSINCTANKCEDIRLVFSPTGEWLASLADGRSTKSYYFKFYSPPTPFMACADQASCLSQATEYSLTTDTFGKGAQKVTSDFVAQTEKSLTSSNPYMKCTNGICVSYTSGSYPLTATAPAGSYYGQCRGYGATINTPEVAIPAVVSSSTVNIVNRAPVPTVSFAKNPINVNEEVNVTCDIVDPDECSDKIAKVKWICTDSNGMSGNCFIWKAGTGQWTAGTFTQDIITSEQNNPYRATAMFKASKAGNYAVTCEATDNDANNPLTGSGINSIAVAQNCEADKICNPNCPSDPDCVPSSNSNSNSNSNPDVVAAHSANCAVISPEGGSSNQLCGKDQKVDYEAYYSGIDPATYKWKCSADAGASETTNPKITCSYGNAGSYLPTLSIVDKNGKETSCVTQTSANVIAEGNGSCQLKIRRAGTGDDFSSKPIKIGAQDQIEAKVDKACIPDGATKWTVNGGSASNQNNSSALIKFKDQSEGSVQAEITDPNGKVYDCGQVKVEVTGKVQFGT